MTPAFLPKDPAYAARIRASFEKQAAMATIGASLERVGPGEVEITLPFSERLSQQHGLVHAGVIATIADSACGYAAMTLMPPGAEVVSIALTLSNLRPARGASFRAHARVLRPGRSITFCEAVVMATDESGKELLIATMHATMHSLLSE